MSAQMSDLTYEQMALYDAFIDAAREVYGDGLRTDGASGTSKMAHTMALFISEVQDD